MSQIAGTVGNKVSTWVNGVLKEVDLGNVKLPKVEGEVGLSGNTMLILAVIAILLLKK